MPNGKNIVSMSRTPEEFYLNQIKYLDKKKMSVEKIEKKLKEENNKIEEKELKNGNKNMNKFNQMYRSLALSKEKNILISWQITSYKL